VPAVCRPVQLLLFGTRARALPAGSAMFVRCLSVLVSSCAAHTYHMPPFAACFLASASVPFVRAESERLPGRQLHNLTHMHACMQVLHVLLGHCRHVLSPVVGWELQAGAVTDRYPELAVLDSQVQLRLCTWQHVRAPSGICFTKMPPNFEVLDT
jgi:hypothetical protein